MPPESGRCLPGVPARRPRPIAAESFFDPADRSSWRRIACTSCHVLRYSIDGFPPQGAATNSTLSHRAAQTLLASNLHSLVTPPRRVDAREPCNENRDEQRADELLEHANGPRLACHRNDVTEARAR